MPRFFGGGSSSVNCNSSDDGSRRASRFEHVFRRLRNDSPTPLSSLRGPQPPSFRISVLEVRQDEDEAPVDGGTIHWTENKRRNAARYSIQPQSVAVTPPSQKNRFGRSQSAQPALLRSSFRRGRRSFPSRQSIANESSDADTSNPSDDSTFAELVGEPAYRPRRSQSDSGAFYVSPNSAVRFRADAISMKRDMEEARNRKRERELLGIDDDDSSSEDSNSFLDDDIIESCVLYEENGKMDLDAGECLVDNDTSCGAIEENLLELEKQHVAKRANVSLWYDFTEACVEPFLCRVFSTPTKNAPGGGLDRGEHIIEFTREEEEYDSESQEIDEDTEGSSLQYTNRTDDDTASSSLYYMNKVISKR